MAKYLALCFAVAGLCLVPWRLPHGRAAPQSDDVYAAVRNNDLARVKTLVGSPADANAKDEQGDSPLLYAAAVGSADAMKYLLDKGADVNVQNPFGSTALMISATDIAKVRLLVEHGADVNRASKQGRTALFIAAMSDQSSRHRPLPGRQRRGSQGEGRVREHRPHGGRDWQRSEHDPRRARRRRGRQRGGTDRPDAALAHGRLRKPGGDNAAARQRGEGEHGGAHRRALSDR